MAKLIVVNRRKLEAGLRRLKAVHARDPQEQELQRNRELEVAEEKARRDADFASRSTQSTP